MLIIMFRNYLRYISLICIVFVTLMVALLHVNDEAFLKTVIMSSGFNHLKFNQESQPTQKKFECSPNFRWVFVKTHKTGSTTLKKVLLPFAAKHGKQIIKKFPPPFVGGYPGHIREEFIFKNLSGKSIPEKSSNDFLITAHHRFNYTALTHLAPKGTRFFSIIRKPWNNFQSSFYYYYNPKGKLNVNHANCFNYPYFHVAKGQRISFMEYLQLVFDSLDETIPWFFRSKNYQAHDLGLDPILDDDTEINTAVKELGSQIDLMMITEHMDESMILLKNLLCMSWSDISYVNRQVSNSYSSISFDENTTMMKRFNKFYKLDIALYDYFNVTFWKRVDAYGRERMMKDVKKLRLLRIESEKKLTSRKARSVPDLQELKVHNKPTKLFLKSLKNYNHESMAQILKQRLMNLHKNVDENQLDSLTNYMIQNNGGCPVEM